MIVWANVPFEILLYAIRLYLKQVVEVHGAGVVWKDEIIMRRAYREERHAMAQQDSWHTEQSHVGGVAHIAHKGRGLDRSRPIYEHTGATSISLERQIRASASISHCIAVCSSGETNFL